METGSNLNLSVGGDGAKLTSVYTGREMKVYAITEPELGSITLLNGLSLFFFSVGSFLLSLGMDIFKDVMIVSAELPQAQMSVIGTIQNFALGASALCYIAGVVFICLRRGRIQTIKEQSRNDNA